MEAYKLISEKEIKEVNGKGLIFEHKKTKARFLVIKNDDKNKTFSIGFRTPPKDDTGVAHILEHSVLCGSRKYPVKDPFVELVKGSLNTFLNAMTFPDKTMYPIASTNDVEFKNLMDVYLDAVFYPNIYKEDRIFKQEGWHIAVDEDDNLSYNGVVYNEMKGASSSPEQVLYQKIGHSLYGEHTYGCESGGEPLAIPNLTYEQFIDFHSTYYHPSNSYIFIYGDVDYEDLLNYIDEEYISLYEYKEIDSAIKDLGLVEKETTEKYFYPVSSTEEVKGKSYLAYNFLINKGDIVKGLAFNILDYVLLSAQGAPLREALIKTGKFEDVYGQYDNGYKQPFFSVVGKHTDEENKDLFKRIIEDTLRDIIKNKLPKNKLVSALNLFEFRYRESDFGTFPKGVIYSIGVMENWLYDLDPISILQYDAAFAELRLKVDEGYFETLIEEEILGSSRKSLVILSADRELQAKNDGKVKEKLAKYKASLSEEEFKKLKEDYSKLDEFRTVPDLKEDYEKIPLLKISDIDEKPELVEYSKEEISGFDVVKHECFTNNIVYSKLIFDMSGFTYDEIKRTGLIISLLRKLDTQNYTYSELSDEVNLHSGGIVFNMQTVNKNFVADDETVYLSACFKTFSEELSKNIELLDEIMNRSSFEDFARMKELIVEQKSKLGNSLMNNGHQTAIVRSMSYHTENGRINDLISGIEYYKYINNLANDDDLLKEELILIKELYGRIFNAKKETVYVNAEKSHLTDAVIKLVDFSKTLFTEDLADTKRSHEEDNKKEGFISSSKVSYNCTSGNFIRGGFNYEGGLKVIKTIITLDYLWKNIRVSGGAYGAFCQFKLDGNSYFATYRDPEVDQSYQVFSKVGEFVANLELDEREIRKFIIGTIASLDTPLSPRIKGEKALSMYLTDTKYEDLVKEREEVLSVDIEKLRSFSELVNATFKDNFICTVGSEAGVKGSKKIENKLNLIG